MAHSQKVADNGAFDLMLHLDSIIAFTGNESIEIIDGWNLENLREYRGGSSRNFIKLLDRNMKPLERLDNSNFSFADYYEFCRKLWREKND